MIEDLRKGLLFSHLGEEQLQRVAKGARRVTLTEGESLFEQGERADRFYLLLRGQVKLYRLSPAGNEKVIEVVTPGSTFAEALMFLDRPHYPVGAQALSAAELISVDAHDFAAMLRGSVDTCFLLLGDMSQRLRGLLREQVLVHLPGGDLVVSWDGDNQPVLMTGPATFVFEGTIQL